VRLRATCCRVVGLPELDQAKMVDIRNAWYEQLGGAPIGNKRESACRAACAPHSLAPTACCLVLGQLRNIGRSWVVWSRVRVRVRVRIWVRVSCPSQPAARLTS